VASKSLKEWLKILGELENECVVCDVFSSRMLLSLSPAAGGSPPLL
jgi:hypothetical protein